MRTAIISQARMTSTRLPGKILLPLAGRAVLDHHLDRLEWSDLPIIVATTTNAEDDPVAELVSGRGHLVYRGDEHDVLARFADSATIHGVDAVVRVTSDCPLIDGHMIRSAVEEWLHLNDPFLYTSNTLNRTYPRGLDFEIFSAQALALAAAGARLVAEREHVTPFLYSGKEARMTIRQVLRVGPDASRFRLTLDTHADYEVLQTFTTELHAHTLTSEKLIDMVSDHPEISVMNANVPQKEIDTTSRRAQDFK